MTASLLLTLTLWQLPANPSDTMRTQSLETVVVTATRSERPMGSLTVPTSVVSGRQIQQMGSLRLNDVLREQTGLAIVSDHGLGVQMQGFGPDYTLILVNGEPLVGRTAGTLDLTRVAVGNIRQVEIVKGPSSSLYGSEALAGVINIITDPLTGKNGGAKSAGSLSARYGANQTSDFSADVGIQLGKLSLYGFGNRYQSAGYTLQPGSGTPTVSPFVNYTGSGRVGYTVSPKLKLTISGRYFSEQQQNKFALTTTEAVSGQGAVREYSLNPILTHQLSDRWKLTYRFYRTGYQTESNLHYTGTGQPYDVSFFRQTFNRPEIIAEHVISPKHILTVGTGLISESVEATRYDDRKRFMTQYGLIQYEWMPSSRLTVIAGGRYDAHSQYASQASPKLSTRFELSETIALRGSVGVGFKTPDFRQLYLNFDNAVAGYSVFGTEVLPEGLARLQRQGQIAEVLLDPARLNTIRAESSTAYNLGAVVNLAKKYDLPAQISINLFRNDIHDLIETQVVARKTNGQNVFSYNNLNRVFTQGIELDGSYRLTVGVSGRLTIQAGYQYLEAKDKSIIEAIQAGAVFRRNAETLASERVTPAQYGGLLNRSRNMANLKLFYEQPQQGLSASLRGIYRGRYGFADRNGNLILDDAGEYVRGYLTWNLSVAKTYKNLALQAGIDNLTGYRDPQFIPTLAGRLWYTNLRWTWGG